MDEISLGKLRKILLPILLGLIIIFFLKLYSIKFSFWILIVLLMAMLLVIKLILVPDTSSLKSKLPSGIKTILIVMIVISVIFFVTQQLSKSANYLELRSPERFTNNEFNKDYGYSRINGGQFAIVDGAGGFGELYVFKAIEITNTGIVWEHPNFGFSIKGIEGTKGERVKVNVLLESRTGSCPFDFVVGPSAGVKDVKFGVGEGDWVWVRENNSPLDIGKKRFNTSVSYDLTVDITSNKPEESAETRQSCSLFIPSFALTEVSFG